MQKFACFNLILILAFCLVFPIQAQERTQMALNELEVLQFLPKDTVTFSVLWNPEELLKTIPWETLKQKYPNQYAEMEKESENELGFNILSVETLQQMGIDIKKPAGFALFDINTKMMAAFVGVANRDQLIASFTNIAIKNKISTQSDIVGSCMVIYEKTEEPKDFILLHSSYVFIITFDGPSTPEKRMATVQSLAQIKKEDSLADSLDYAKTVIALGYKGDVGGYFNFSILIQTMLDEMKANLEKPAPNYAEERVKTLEKENAPAEEIQEWKERAKEEEQWQAQSKQRQQKDYEFAKFFLQPIQGMAWCGKIGEKAIEVKMHLGIAQDSLLFNMLQDIEKTPKLIQTLAKRPILLEDFVFNSNVLKEFLGKALELDNDLIMLQNELKKEMDLDLKNDIFFLLGSEIGFALERQPSNAKSIEEFFNAINFVVLLQVSDSTKAKLVLEKIVSSPNVKEMIEKNADMSAYTLLNPWKPLYLKVTDGYFIFFSDKDYSSNFASETPKSFATEYSHTGMQQFLKMSNLSSLFILDFEMIAGNFPTIERPYWEMPDFDDSPKPEAYTKKLQEIKALKRKIFDLEQEQTKKELTAISTIMKRFGTFAVSGKREMQGISIYVSEFVLDESIYALVSHTIEDGMMVEKTKEDNRAETQAMYEQLSKLQQELEETKFSEEPK